MSLRSFERVQHQLAQGETMSQRNKKRPGPKPAKGLTKAQERLMATIRTFFADNGLPPTIKELADILSMAGPSVHEQINIMVRKGYLRRHPRRSRAIEIVDQSTRQSEEIKIAKQPPRKSQDATITEQPAQICLMVPLPIVGKVAAGLPILAVENVVGELQIEASFARGQCFALEIVGDSMVDAEIMEGDYVIVRQQPIAENGDIVIALIEDEATVKRLFIDDDLIELRPANSAYQPIRIGPDDELRILGKVMAVRRTKR